jgi:septum formation protein
MDLYLASESPRRRDLLGLIVKEFAQESAAVCEIAAGNGVTPLQAALCNAARKADAVAARHPASWVIGADTVVVMDDKLYGKPADMEEAFRFLQSFAGRTHSVITAVALRRGCCNIKDDFYAESQVKFRNCSEAVIREYLAKVPVLDKAGAYGIQEHGEMLVESFSGELENIIGLPVCALRRHLKEVGFEGLL